MSMFANRPLYGLLEMIREIGDESLFGSFVGFCYFYLRDSPIDNSIMIVYKNFRPVFSLLTV
jgi:hypothetical protein